MRSDALIALTRFGLGPRRGEREHVAGDPRGFVLAQLTDRDAARIDGLMTLKELRDFYAKIDKPYAAAAARLGDGGTDGEMKALDKARRFRAQSIRDVMEEEIGARFQRGASTEAAFVERLVLFWSNHFAIDRNRNKRSRVLAGNYEREAIRPYVLGKFSDLLPAAILHPAMLEYLDNIKNMAPDSVRGRRRGVKAANENLARELLELHTLGAGSGYTQEDVQQVALMLAGWTGGFGRGIPVFEFRSHGHAPRTVLGTTYPTAGSEQIEMLLADLAKHPATANHIARKLARHFVGDIAPATLVEALEATFVETDGDLREVALTLASHDAAWAPAAYKTVPPYDFTVAAARALGQTDLPPRLVMDATKDLAQDIWAAPSPAGWPDDDNAFLGGDSMLERIDFAADLVQRSSSLPDVRDLAVELFGEDLAPEVAQSVARAEDTRQAGVLLLMSPPFQRR